LDRITEKTLEFERIEHAINLFGNFDENVKLIEEGLGVDIISRDENIRIVGDEANVEKAFVIIQRLMSIAVQGDVITKQNVNYLLQLAVDNQLDKVRDYPADCICLTARGKQIKSKTHGQKKYATAIKNNTITFGIGPAGTGKTFLAVAMAVTAFRDKQVNRIILTRPAVEAGEKLGFLPGVIQNKVYPYLRPLYDSLYEIMGAETYQKYLEKGMIEVAPLAYMRGRSLDDSFIILDEAQNTTPEQMKMFLTRIGFGSKAVITGDVTQIDLPGDKKSGLKEVIKVLKDIQGIEFVNLTEKDVIRHELVQSIIKAYEKYDSMKT
jgi:phosphate starvation-inducible PhoH-like protein